MCSTYTGERPCLRAEAVVEHAQGAVLPRETRAAAAVAFSAALQVPDVHPAVTALQVAKACCPNDDLTIPGECHSIGLHRKKFSCNVHAL